jgi:hypothetical protein
VELDVTPIANHGLIGGSLGVLAYAAPRCSIAYFPVILRFIGGPRAEHSGNQCPSPPDLGQFSIDERVFSSCERRGTE